MTAASSALSNTRHSYGQVERVFHWSTALLILTAAALGLIADAMSYDTDAQLSRKALTYSLHKTIGVTLFFVALARILWALFQPRPYPLHAERRAEDFLASTVHWMLYGSLLIVPLLGWAYHATTVGFAPILWPFSQNLPLIPKDPALGAILSSLHKLSVLILFMALALHIYGTIKHVVFDRDLTFDRMWRGANPERTLEPSRFPAVLPFCLATLIWAGAMFYGVKTTPNFDRSETVDVSSDEARPVDVEGEDESAGNWTVEDGRLAITVIQQDQIVTGQFQDWTAIIDFEPEPNADGHFGTIKAHITLDSLQLGAVTSDALSGEFLAADLYPVSVFEAVILSGDQDGRYIADGTLRLRDQIVPLRLPFDLSISDDVATATATIQLDRRRFGIGPSYPDESNIGFGVTVDLDLTANRR